MPRKTDIYFNVETLWKTPTESVKYNDFDFVDDIPASDSILAMGATSATSIKAFDKSSNDVTSQIVSATTISGTKLQCMLQNGVNGMDYLIVAKAQMTTSGETPEKFIKLKVRSVPVV